MKVVKTMISLIIAASLFLLGSSFYTGHATQTAVPFKKPAIVFDLGGVVFDTSRSTFIIQQLGRNALPYILLHCSKMHIKDRWFETLNQLAAEHQYNTSLVDHEGTPIVLRDEADTPLPLYIVQWIQGMRPNRSIYREVRNGIKAHPEWFGPFEQRLMLNMTRAIFKPEQLAASRKLIKPTVSLIKKLKKQGYPLYVLSNWDPETFTHMKEQYAELFELFDGIMISGEVHTAKPSKDIYNLFMNTFPHDCYCLIDDQQDNVDAAKQCGWYAIKAESRKPDIKDIKKHIAAYAMA